MEQAEQSDLTPELKALHRKIVERIERIVLEWTIIPPNVRKSVGLVKWKGFKADERFITPSESQTKGHQKKYNLGLDPYNPHESDIEDPQGKYKSPLRHKLLYWFDENGSAGKLHFIVPVDPLSDEKDWPSRDDFPRLLGEEISQDKRLSGGDYENIAYILNQLEERLQLESHH